MNFCPANADKFGHHLTPDQAREWCRTTHCNADREMCEFAHRWVDPKAKKAVAKGSAATPKPEQKKLF